MVVLLPRPDRGWPTAAIDNPSEAVVSDLEIERKESLTRGEAAKRLMAIAEALAGGDKVELDLGGTSLTLRVADDVRAEVEIEVDGDEVELEFELKWSLRRDSGAADGKATEEPVKPKARHR
jgi:amphi-Trp domain-containing protein